jgi:hypothetical protein
MVGMQMILFTKVGIKFLACAAMVNLQVWDFHEGQVERIGQ